jgi:hypothetical protein
VADDDTLSPSAQLRFQLVTIQLAKERVQRRRTRRVVGQAESVSDTGTVIAPPCGDGTLALGVTSHRTTGQRKHGGEGMAFAPTAAKGRNLSEDLDERLRLCAHGGLPSQRVLAHTGRAG